MTYPPSFINYCKTLNSKLTSLRKSVLYILWGTKKPLKAYEILDCLLQIKENSKPSTVYRVLDYFIACGIVHKIESIQSYILCQEPVKPSLSEFLLVCKRCHQVNEICDKSLFKLIAQLVETYHFSLNQEAIELKGACFNCREESNLCLP
ncbi:Fe2+/Zn2+ uptake regulation proteins [Legionella beliardensis]|uniref:Fe2+/Zn2+ uptake regulation proteins n=1 Tax=Legionella beliardensis TaxID=91822 RepID=A0A378I3Z1_9GAMM|nr:transcriptional repressor [Legionella beliardensis]STX29917.1 Fe2+/Zn2+ uptake regulation proteins [Legionella beliardensis]